MGIEPAGAPGPASQGQKDERPCALYLFAGSQRKSGLAECLRKRKWKVVELDIVRSNRHDLTKPQVREALLKRISAGTFTAVVASPPCDTFTRVKFANNRGPPPTRSAVHLRGLPWISPSLKRINQLANTLTDFTTEAALVQAKLSTGLLAIESPEDLGALTSGPHRGTRPGPICAVERVTTAEGPFGVREFGLRQSDFGTPLLKPTRILLKGNPAEAVLFEGAPVFDQLGKYCGPIPKHSTDFSKFKSLAKAAGETGFRTTGTAAWPSPMWEWMAKTLHNS